MSLRYVTHFLSDTSSAIAVLFLIYRLSHISPQIYRYVGRTQSRKSTLAALILSFFGNFNASCLPANFKDTANALEKKGFILKDVLMIVDDFHPASTLNERKNMEQNMQAISRMYGDRRARSRLNYDITLRNGNIPRGNVAVTGEDIAHIMLTMRPINENGTWGDKQKKEYILDADGRKIYDKRKRTYKCKTVQTTDWNSKEKAEEWRTEWADFLNNALAENNISERFDHRSFERQGKEELPTIHMGVSAAQMERKGIRTVKGDINREILENNRRLREIEKAIIGTKKNIAILSEQSKEENIIEKLIRFHDNGIKFAEVRGLKLSSLKSAEKLKDMSAAIAFLQGKNISYMSGVEKMLNDVNSDYNALKSRIISNNSRRKELSELLSNYENYKPNKAVFQKYESIANPKKKEKFYNAHSSEIEIFKAAKNYFGNTLVDNKITPKAWKAEMSEIEKFLASDRQKLIHLEEETAILSTIAYNMKILDNYDVKQQIHNIKRSTEIE